MHASGRRTPSTAAMVIALLTVYLVWGSTYLGIAVMIETMPPLLAVGLRYVLAGLLMIAGVWLFARLSGGQPLERPTRSEWRTAAIVGVLLLLGGNGGVALGEQFIPSGVAAVLIATTPIWLSVFDSIATRRRLSRLVGGGVVAGIIGVVIMLVPAEGIGDLDPVGVVLVLGAAVSWAMGSIYSREAPAPRHALLGTGMIMLAGGVAQVIVAILVGEGGQLQLAEISARSWVAFAYLVAIGSLVGFTAYAWLLANVPIAIVSTYAYVNPVVAVILGALVLSEPITPRTLLAAIVIIGAVVAMVSGRPRASEGRSPAGATTA